MTLAGKLILAAFAVRTSSPRVKIFSLRVSSPSNVVFEIAIDSHVSRFVPFTMVLIFSDNSEIAFGFDLSDIVICLLYTSDAADDLLCVDLGGRRIIKK